MWEFKSTMIQEVRSVDGEFDGMCVEWDQDDALI